MSEEEFRRKIIKDIRKSGFLSEMLTNSCLIKCGWTNTTNAESFLDKDLSKSREIDITSYKNKYDSKIKITVGIHLILEVKKSEKPWIIFCHKRDHKRHIGLGYGILHFKDNINPSLLSYEDINSKNRHANSVYLGTSYYEAFKEPSESSQIYSALITACKAATSERELNSWETSDKKKFDPDKHAHIEFFLPTVVLDGRLFKSTLNLEGEPEITEESYLPIKLNYSSQNYKETTFYPEIVTLSGLEEHLNSVERWLESIHRFVLKKLKATNLDS